MNNRKSELYHRTVELLLKAGSKRVYTPDEIQDGTYLVHGVGEEDTQVHWRDFPLFFTEQYNGAGRLMWAEVYHIPLEKGTKIHSAGQGFGHIAQKLKSWMGTL